MAEPFRDLIVKGRSLAEALGATVEGKTREQADAINRLLAVFDVLSDFSGLAEMAAGLQAVCDCNVFQEFHAEAGELIDEIELNLIAGGSAAVKRALRYAKELAAAWEKAQRASIGEGGEG